MEILSATFKNTFLLTLFKQYIIIYYMKTKDAKIISGFPGTGKTYCKRKHSYLNISDSDSTFFSWTEKNGIKIRNKKFPKNYIQYIKRNKRCYDIIFISTHEEVRNALIKEKLAFTLVVPEKTLKSEYITRFMKRRNDQNFIDLININWNTWLNDIDRFALQKNVPIIKLQENQYLFDILKDQL